MSREHPPTVVVGFDALDFRYLDEFDLPTFESIRSRGVEAPLAATFPPWTGSAWPSVYTGCEPSHHGVYSFFDFSDSYPDDAPTVSRHHVDAPAVWNYLTDRDRTSVVLNVPVTHPAEPIDGVLVPGYLAPEDASGYPEGIRSTLSERLGEEYRIYSAAETGADDETKLDGYLDLIHLRGRAAASLVDSHDPDLLFLQIQKTDAVFHNFDSRSAFRRVYRAADSVLRDVLSAVGGTPNVVLCSDHGMGPTTGFKIHVNEILREADLVATTEDGSVPNLSEAKDALTGESEASDGDGTLDRRLVTAAQSALGTVGVTPGDVQAFLRRMGIEETAMRLLPAGVRSDFGTTVDWRRSKAYARIGCELGVRINLAGRDEHGVVPPDDYERVRDEIVSLLSAVRTPAGERAFDFVEPREAVYEGPHSDVACDVLFKPADMNHTVATNLVGRQFVPTDVYDHKSEGVFIAAGPSIDGETTLGTRSVTDVAPLVLALQGCPIPERMTGDPPATLLPGGPTYHRYDVDFGTDAASVDSDADVQARLEDLGYL